MMSWRKPLRVLLHATVMVGIGLATTLAANAAATVIVINNDGPGQGFNDPTAAVPVGGNSGTTVGQQRLIAFQTAANIWGQLLNSSVPIRVGARFSALTCSANSAVLGSAGPANAWRDFTGAPAGGTWYAVALANALHGSDLDAGDDITANFSSVIGTNGCLQNSGWYYGLDSNPPGNRIDFVSVLIHELGHGLGFLTFVDLTTGQKAGGFNDAFMLNLENHGASPADYASMSDAQRVAASRATGNLHWVGPNVRAASGSLSAGKVGDHVRMYAPNPQEPGSSVSHWDTALTPNQVMEPSYTQALHTPVLELPAFQDIGWSLGVTFGGAPSKFGTHDFNGDGRSDVVWRDTSGNIQMWLMFGAAVGQSVSVGNIQPVWSIVGQRDFNGDGKHDFLWRDTAGNVSIWLMNGGALASGLVLGSVPANWSVVGTGDFNGDGKGDILWRDGGGNVAVWFMNGTSLLAVATLGYIPANWSVVGTGDFNGDNKTDVLWRDGGGNVAVWFMNGLQIASVVTLGNIPANWSVVGTADFDGNGKTDILWRDGGGNVAAWFMNGAAIASVVTLGNIPTNWSVAQTGDYNRDAKGDVLWRNSAGDVAVWFMNGAAISQVSSLGNIPLVWSIQSQNVD